MRFHKFTLWLKCIKYQCNKLMYATDMPVANNGWLMQSSTKYQAIGYSVKKVLTIYGRPM